MNIREEYGDVLGLGKVSAEVMRRSVFPFLPLEEEPSLDGGVIPLGGRTILAHSPSIGVPVEALGFFAFHYAASNVAVRFACPRYLVTGIYLPLKTREEDLRTVAKGLGDEARRFGVTVVTGQTATYYGLEIPLLTTTCFGESVRLPRDPQKGDIIFIAGAVGGEAVWLKALSQGKTGEEWRDFTPLSIALGFHGVELIRLMHDVSEGGVKKALHEVADAINLRIKVDSCKIHYASGVEGLGQDVLRAPTYGALIVIADPLAVDDVLSVCDCLGKPCAAVGVVEEGEGVFIDGEKVEDLQRIAIDAVYGTFQERDEVLDTLREVLSELEASKGFSSLIPQVGTNMVYAKQDASSTDEVAGLSGRVVLSRGTPKVCGEVLYGGSKHMASVILEVSKLNPHMRAAVNIRGGEDVVKALREMNISLQVLPPEATGDACPVTTDIRESKKLHKAYYHPGAFGVEPSTTLIGEMPKQLLNTIVELARRV